METITLNVTGMACGGCANTVRQALLALDGVVGTEVSHVDGLAHVSFDPAIIQKAELASAIQKAGYGVS